MKTTTLMTTAAAVLLSASLASAQAVKHDEKSEGAAKAPAAQQNAPAEKMSPAMEKKETTGQASQPSAAPKAAEDSKADKSKKETTGQAPKSEDSGKSQTQMNAPSGAASGKATTEEKTKSNAAQPSSSQSTQTQSPAQSQSSQSTTVKSQATTGQGAAGTAANLSTEQRTKITTVIKQQKVAPIQANFTINVGTRVPESVRFHPLPQEVIVIYPEWRGYDYVLVGDSILVIDPRSREIVAVLPA